MRIHIPSLPHTQTTSFWSTCAFTQKVRHLCDMLTFQGHEVYLYSGEENEAECAEHVVVVTADDRKRWFGEETWEDRVFDRWNLIDPCWVEFNGRIITEISNRISSNDLIALPMGLSHRQIALAFPDHVSFESGIGYEAIIPEAHHVFESQSWMHNRYGAFGINDGRFFDCVIPNAFDENDFQLSGKGDYVLFLGRHTPRKGLAVVKEIAKHHRVITAGQGEARVPGAEYIGVVRGKERAEILSGAKALIAPTIYIEPFGGVVVEAQLSGTVPITTNFGAFTETITQGYTGFRCNMLSDFLEAIDKADTIDGEFLRHYAIEMYSKKAVSRMYDSYLTDLSSLYSDGWYANVRRTE